jgi:uncharacterized protein (TIGR00661 family)
LNKDVPRPRFKDALGSFILKNYAPASYHFGLHFSRYASNIYTPVLRREIRESPCSDAGHYTVYLPAYDDEILVKLLGKIPEVDWQVFSKNCKIPQTINNINLFPVDNKSFLQSLISCSGVLCGAGFETPAEALFLGKKLMVVPMQNQYEQVLNAEALKGMGVPVIKKLKASNIEKVNEWIRSEYRIEITYPDVTDKIITRIFEMYIEGKFPRGKWKDDYQLVPQEKD